MKYSGKSIPVNGAAALLIILLTGTTACSDRERANPFDPRGPNYGEMEWLNALAGNGKVYLYWGSLDYADLAGFDIIRVSLADQDTAVLNDTTLAAREVAFLDSTAENNITYAYNLRLLLTDSNERPMTKPDLATPGRIFGWLVTGDGGNVAYMTPDFRDEVYRLDADFMHADDLQLTPGQEEVWVLDKSYDNISRFSLYGEPLEGNPVFSNTAAFAFNYQDRSLWIAVSGSEGVLYHFGANGTLAESFRTDARATSLAVNYPENGVWVGSSDKLVLRIGNGEVSRFEHTDFSHPETVAAGRYSTIAWILDTEARILFHTAEPNKVFRLANYTDPTDIAVSDDGSICWVADPTANILYEIDLQANTVGRLENLGEPWRLTYSRYDNTVYVSGDAGKISKVGPGAALIWQVDYPNYPGKIALEFRN